jgi:hypothetical protein
MKVLEKSLEVIELNLLNFLRKVIEIHIERLKIEILQSKNLMKDLLKQKYNKREIYDMVI